MYLHIGQETVVRFSDIIGIFDIETASVSGITRDYLAKAQKDGRVVNVTNELPKSFVVTSDAGTREETDSRVYISQISSTTLLKRTAVSAAGTSGATGLPGDKNDKPAR